MYNVGPFTSPSTSLSLGVAAPTIAVLLPGGTNTLPGVLAEPRVVGSLLHRELQFACPPAVGIGPLLSNSHGASHARS